MSEEREEKKPPRLLTIDPTDPEVIAICSMLCFKCARIAERLRQGGYQIETRAEDEQAKVILWLLGKYAEYGSDWREKAPADLRAMGQSRKNEPPLNRH
jgi:hypothetical protein